MFVRVFVGCVCVFKSGLFTAIFLVPAIQGSLLQALNTDQPFVTTHIYH